MRRRQGGFFCLKFDCADVFDMLERHGTVPLPPYIEHAADVEDETRYQTVYARDAGRGGRADSRAAFRRTLLDALRSRGVALAYVTLHVGAGTFQPVRVEDVQPRDAQRMV